MIKIEYLCYRLNAQQGVALLRALGSEYVPKPQSFIAQGQIKRHSNDRFTHHIVINTDALPPSLQPPIVAHELIEGTLNIRDMVSGSFTFGKAMLNHCEAIRVGEYPTAQKLGVAGQLYQLFRRYPQGFLERKYREQIYRR